MELAIDEVLRMNVDNLSSRPLSLVDVDGPLNPFAAMQTINPMDTRPTAGSPRAGWPPK
jgi:hypothetical protein